MNDAVDIPDENEDRRVRTSLSTMSGMAYGIADSLGKNEHQCMIDLVQEWSKDKAIFAMFGRPHPPILPPGASPNQLAKFLKDRLVDTLRKQLAMLKTNQAEGVPDALRRTFLKLNQDLHDSLFTSTRKMSHSSGTSTGTTAGVDPVTLRSGVSGIVLYFVGQTLYVANAGKALAVVSKQGTAQLVSRAHDPYDRSETARIRAAEGWVSPPGLVNEEVDLSRAFGFYHLLPVINARPDVFTYQISLQDEFVIVANCGLWDYVSYQTAVDIARTERADPMIAVQKLRDFAISYGADGSTMIMVIGLAETLDPGVPKKKNIILDCMISRLDGEVPPPVGHIALVFTDIRNSTPLWEANPGMATAHRIHNSLFRRQLRFCGGYEVKTEGHSFMCSFSTSLAAVWFCLTVQRQLLHKSWPGEILQSEEGKPIYDAHKCLIERGLSVRMGIHCGTPVHEPDPVTHHMDYFGPIVNCSGRISDYACGGQIMCSADIIREINATVFETEPKTEYSRVQPQQAIDAIREMDVKIIPVGDVKFKGLEVPEYVSLLYPGDLVGRYESEPKQKEHIPPTGVENESKARSSSRECFADPDTFLPHINDKSMDSDLGKLLHSFTIRINNAASELESLLFPDTPLLHQTTIMSALTKSGEFDDRTLQRILSVLQNI
jgi:adenylate cyclase